MNRRLELHKILVDILGSENVYFQKPENLVMKYPCIVYTRDHAMTSYADNKPYRHTKRYSITVIDPNPDSEIPDKIANLPYSVFDRHFETQGLNHDVYNVYF